MNKIEIAENNGCYSIRVDFCDSKSVDDMIACLTYSLIVKDVTTIKRIRNAVKRGTFDAEMYARLTETEWDRVLRILHEKRRRKRLVLCKLVSFVENLVTFAFFVLAWLSIESRAFGMIGVLALSFYTVHASFKRLKDKVKPIER